jgi:hypothetical protein
MVFLRGSPTSCRTARERAVGKIERRRPINAKPVYLRQFLASESRAP